MSFLPNMKEPSPMHEQNMSWMLLEPCFITTRNERYSPPPLPSVNIRGTGTQRATERNESGSIKLKYLMRPTLSNAESALAEAELDSEEGGAAAKSSPDDVL